MRVKMILPALTEAHSPFFRPIKYSLFPPLGLATLAGYLRDDDEVSLHDEHVESVDLEAGYWRAYASFYRWSAIFRGATTKTDLRNRLRHLAYAVGWKKLEPLWDLVIRAKRVSFMLPILESVLSGCKSVRRVTPERNIVHHDDQPAAVALALSPGPSD